MILAESEEDADRIFRNNLNEIIEHDSNKNSLEALTKFPLGWDKWCLPWGTEDDRSICELVYDGSVDGSYQFLLDEK